MLEAFLEPVATKKTSSYRADEVLVEGLQAALGDERVDVARSAARVLDGLTFTGNRVDEALAGALAHPDATVRLRALEGIERNVDLGPLPGPDFLANVTERPQFGTQSGPMLVIDGKLHPEFSQDGDSRLIRNGVGVDDRGRAHFVISNGPISFGKLARFYRDSEMAAIMACRA